MEKKSRDSAILVFAQRCFSNLFLWLLNFLKYKITSLLVGSFAWAVTSSHLTMASFPTVLCLPSTGPKICPGSQASHPVSGEVG